MASQQPSENTQSDGDSKKDPGWKHCYLKNPKDSNSVTCRFCGFTSNGGIFRAKQHIAGNSKNVRKCKECPQSVRDEMLNYMNEKKKQTLRACGGMKQNFSFFDIEEDEDDEEVARAASSKESKKRSLTSTNETGSGSGKGPMDLFIMKKKTKGGKLKQTSINDACDKELRDRTVQKIARFMYQAAISFNAAHLDSFKEMIEAIGQYGPNLKPPSYHELRVPLLQKEIVYTNELLKENRDECEKYGCSIMSDGWTDRKHRTLINFLVNSPKGTMFLESVDASANVKTGTLLYELLDSFVERVGEKNVVQVITDNGSNYVLAGKLLQAKRPNLFWTPCAAHCIDLMLEDIGKIEVVKKTISRAIALVGFIYNHGGVLHMMREFTENKELARHGVTRFATTFLTLQSIHKRQKALKRMFLSAQWMDSKWAKDAKGKRANDTVFMPSFWNNVTYTLKLMCPLVMVLRIADNEKRPPMGYIYEAMDRAKETIMKSFENNREKCQKVLDSIDIRWENQLHHPLHAAGYYLNPYFYYHNPRVEADTEVTKGLFVCIQRLIPSPEVMDKIIMEELPIYKNSESLFGNEFAIRARNNKDQPMAPADWWKMFGNGTPNLKEFAIKVLSLTCSASGCERNWSIFEHIHSKKRNRLDHKKLRDLVYVKYNQTLKARAIKKDKADPIVLRNIDDCNNEWMTGEMEAGNEPVFDDDDDTLTWNIVADAAGVEEETRHTRQRTSNPCMGASTSTSRGKSRGGRRDETTRQPTHTQRSLMDEESSDGEEFDDDVLKDDYSDVDEKVDDDGVDEMIELESD